MSYHDIHEINDQDRADLAQLAAAEDAGLLLPPISIDALIRLSRRGLVSAGSTRSFVVTPAGRDSIKAFGVAQQQDQTPVAKPTWSAASVVAQYAECR